MRTSCSMHYITQNHFYLGGNVGKHSTSIGERLVVYYMPMEHVQLVVRHCVKVTENGIHIQKVTRSVYHCSSVVETRLVLYLSDFIDSKLCINICGKKWSL